MNTIYNHPHFSLNKKIKGRILWAEILQIPQVVKLLRLGLIIVDKAEWLGSPANIKGANRESRFRLEGP